MPLILLILLAGVLGYMFWKRSTTSLTRNCRWRRQSAQGGWFCAYCGAQTSGDDSPKWCGHQSGPKT